MTESMEERGHQNGHKRSDYTNTLSGFIAR